MFSLASLVCYLYSLGFHWFCLGVHWFSLALHLFSLGFHVFSLAFHWFCLGFHGLPLGFSGVLRLIEYSLGRIYVLAKWCFSTLVLPYIVRIMLWWCAAYLVLLCMRFHCFMLARVCDLTVVACSFTMAPPRRGTFASKSPWKAKQRGNGLGSLPSNWRRWSHKSSFVNRILIRKWLAQERWQNLRIWPWRGHCWKSSFVNRVLIENYLFERGDKSPESGHGEASVGNHQLSIGS